MSSFRRYWIVFDSEIPLPKNENGEVVVRIIDSAGGTWSKVAEEIHLCAGDKPNENQ